MAKYNHVCEVCGHTEVLTPEEAFSKGWDYPPQMGVFGVISARTCGNCLMDKTLWWKFTMGEVNDVSDLTESELVTLNRILGEPGSIIVYDD